MRIALALAAALFAAPAAAHDPVNPARTVSIPDGPIVVLHRFWPHFRRAGTGHVRLAYHDPGLAARLNLPETYAYEEAYTRALTRLSFRMSPARAEAAARHEAWHAVVGGRGDAIGVVERRIPRN